MAIIPMDLMDRLKASESTPSATTAHSLDEQLAFLMQKTDMSDFDKALLYQDVLQKYLTFKGQSRQPIKIDITSPNVERLTTPINRSTDHTEESERVLDYGSIVQQIPKTYRTRAGHVLEYLKDKPNILTWNDKRELVFEKDSIEGSNIVDLLYDAVRSRGKDLNPKGWKEFFQGLSMLNVPEYLIGNPLRRKLVQDIKANRSIEVQEWSKSPKKKKKRSGGQSLTWATIKH